MKYGLKNRVGTQVLTAKYDTPEKAWDAVHPTNREYFVVVGIREEIVPMKQVTTWVEDK